VHRERLTGADGEGPHRRLASGFVSWLHGGMISVSA
jgi:hypothetical protein